MDEKKNDVITLDAGQFTQGDVENLIKVLAKAAEQQAGNLFMSYGETEKQLAEGMNSLVRGRSLLFTILAQVQALNAKKKEGENTPSESVSS